MVDRARRIGCLAVMLSLLFLPAACGDDEVLWEASRSATFGSADDDEQREVQWRRYRESVVRSLESMEMALEVARGEVPAGYDRNEVDALSARVVDLRGRMRSEMDEPREAAATIRKGLRSDFAKVREEVDALLTRLGHSADEMARWQDVE